jgi:hypothetical protein
MGEQKGDACSRGFKENLWVWDHKYLREAGRIEGTDLALGHTSESFYEFEPPFHTSFLFNFR